MSATNLQNRTFFVTGANSGIGRALVQALAARGGRVVLATRSEERTKALLEEIQRRYPAARPHWVQLDVSDLGSVRRAAQAYVAAGHPIDVLVNNAGIAGTRDAGIVDQHVDRVTGRDVGLGGAPHRAEIRHVELHPVWPRGRVAALDLFQQGLRPLFGARGEHHAAATRCEGLDQGAAYP